MISPNIQGEQTGSYRIVSDLLGSVRQVVDLSDGAVVQRLDYDVWGNVTLNTNPDLQPFGFAGGDTNLYGYVANDPVNFIDPSGLEVDGGKHHETIQSMRSKSAYFNNMYSIASKANFNISFRNFGDSGTSFLSKPASGKMTFFSGYIIAISDDVTDFYCPTINGPQKITLEQTIAHELAWTILSELTGKDTVNTISYVIDVENRVMSELSPNWNSRDRENPKISKDPSKVK